MNKIDELKEQTEIVYTLIRDYEDIQKEMVIARDETTNFAKQLGMDQFVAKNHPSVMSFLIGYTKGRTSIINTISTYLKGE